MKKVLPYLLSLAASLSGALTCYCFASGAGAYVSAFSQDLVRGILLLALALGFGVLTGVLLFFRFRRFPPSSNISRVTLCVELFAAFLLLVWLWEKLEEIFSPIIFG